MNNNREIIDVVCREMPASSANPVRTWAAVLPLLCAAIAGGAAFDLWSGNAAMFALLGVAAVALLLGLRLTSGKRISGVFGLSAFVGLAGVALSLASVNAVLSVAGLGIAGFAMLVLSKITIRGWEHV